MKNKMREEVVATMTKEQQQIKHGWEFVKFGSIGFLRIVHFLSQGKIFPSYDIQSCIHVQKQALYSTCYYK